MTPFQLVSTKSESRRSRPVRVGRGRATVERAAAVFRSTRVGSHALVLALLIAVSSGCGDSDHATSATEPSQVSPWQRTEEREPCQDLNILRTPYFGDLHSHTSFSADAYIFGTRVDPRGAYDFARGTAIPLADDNEQQTRSAQIDRPLDFAAVTDHAEWLGEVKLCTTPDSPVYDVKLCELLRQVEDPEDRLPVTVQWQFPAGAQNPPPWLPLCDLPGADCGAAKVSVWQEIHAAANEAYDRSAACTFTNFVGYEHTDSPLARHLHRNIIFRNDHIPRFPANRMDTYADGTPQGVWLAVERDCLNAGEGCDAVIIPHNSNLSGGQQWLDPADAAEARRRQDREPLVEIHQNKGNSECRFDRLAGLGLSTDDQLCTFEQRLVAHELGGQPPPSIGEYPRRNMVRNTLKDGLVFEEILGVNPFKLGFVGGTDTHDATSGNTKEGSWPGCMGNSDSNPARRIGNIRDNPGGLTAVWAEENSRDAIFAALARRETYATSGTRPVVRFFAGALPDVECGAADFVESAYKNGTPMGGELGPVRGDASPRFAVLAMKDPGTAEAPGTDLQRIQIVKGWLDTSGQTHERVFDLAGDPENGAGVDPATCAPVGKGARELCAVWEDPDFERAQRAFYYVRVLENPTCRWSTLECKSVGVDPFSTQCAAQAATAGEAFANCCLNEDNDAFFEPIIQERAWASPIWYRPEAIASVEGAIEFGSRPDSDVLDLTIRIGQIPRAFDLQKADLKVSLTDNDEIFGVTFRAGAFRETNPTHFVYEDAEGSLSGVTMASLRIEANGEGWIELRTRPVDLASADRTDHMVTVQIGIGTYEAVHTRLWEATGSRLGPR
jgi:hypothetical protein